MTNCNCIFFIWGKVVPDEKPVNTHGCFLYASCSLISNLIGRPYTLEQLFKDSGTIIDYKDGQFELVQKGDIKSLDGSPWELQNNLDRAGIKASVSSKYLSIDDVKKGLKDGKEYVIWYKYYKSSGEIGNHWVTLAGLDENDNIIILCSNEGSNRHDLIGNNISEISNSFISLDCMYEVTLLSD